MLKFQGPFKKIRLRTWFLWLVAGLSPLSRGRLWQSFGKNEVTLGAITSMLLQTNETVSSITWVTRELTIEATFFWHQMQEFPPSPSSQYVTGWSYLIFTENYVVWLNIKKVASPICNQTVKELCYRHQCENNVIILDKIKKYFIKTFNPSCCFRKQMNKIRTISRLEEKKYIFLKLSKSVNEKGNWIPL